MDSVRPKVESLKERRYDKEMDEDTFEVFCEENEIEIGDLVEGADNE